MTRNNLYDLTSAPNKSPGAFTTYFYGWQEPYVLSNYDDAGTYIHEMGHALNFFRTGDLMVLEQDLQGSDISEIHSQTLGTAGQPLAEPHLYRRQRGGEIQCFRNVYHHPLRNYDRRVSAQGIRNS